MVSSVLLGFGLWYLALTPSCGQCYMGLPGTVLFSLSYALYVPTLWTSPSLLVGKESVGLAYGYIGCVRNLGVSVVTILTGLVSDRFKGYFMVAHTLIIDCEIPRIGSSTWGDRCYCPNHI